MQRNRDEGPGAWAETESIAVTEPTAAAAGEPPLGGHGDVAGADTAAPGVYCATGNRWEGEVKAGNRKVPGTEARGQPTLVGSLQSEGGSDSSGAMLMNATDDFSKTLTGGPVQAGAANGERPTAAAGILHPRRRFWFPRPASRKPPPSSAPPSAPVSQRTGRRRFRLLPPPGIGVLRFLPGERRAERRRAGHRLYQVMRRMRGMARLEVPTQGMTGCALAGDLGVFPPETPATGGWPAKHWTLKTAAMIYASGVRTPSGSAAGDPAPGATVTAAGDATGAHRFAAVPHAVQCGDGTSAGAGTCRTGAGGERARYAAARAGGEFPAGVSVRRVAGDRACLAGGCGIRGRDGHGRVRLRDRRGVARAGGADRLSQCRFGAVAAVESAGGEGDRDVSVESIGHAIVGASVAVGAARRWHLAAGGHTAHGHAGQLGHRCRFGAHAEPTVGALSGFGGRCWHVAIPHRDGGWHSHRSDSRGGAAPLGARGAFAG
eukprot:ctg_10.g3